jgi:hypothetical protein
LLSQLAGLRSAVLRTFALGLLTLLAPTLAVLGILASPASAHVSEVGGTKFGVQRHSAPASLFEGEELEPATFANKAADPVLHQNSTYVVYWDPDYRYLDPWTEVIDQFFQNMSTASGQLASVFAVDTQYTDKTNKPAFFKSAFRGSYADKAPYPSPAGCTNPEPLGEGENLTCLSDKQIRAQLESFISREKLPKGMGTIYYLLTPPGVTVCTDEGPSAEHCSSNSSSPESFCSYHAAITPTNPSTGDATTILYGVIPWTAGSIGDPLLVPGKRLSGYDCQDGGFDPSSKPVVEEKEKAKKKTEKEIEEFGKKNKEEKEAIEKTEKAEGPHQQEPNQFSSSEQPTCPHNLYNGGCEVGLADVIITQIASEQQDIVTDPLLNAWQDKNHNEVVDECRNFFALVTGGSVTANEESGAGTLYNQTFGAGNYYLNDAFNASGLKIYQPRSNPCVQHVNLIPSFTAPTPVNAGEIVGLNGLESNVELDAAVDFPGGGPEKLTYATYTWNFGDGSPTVSGFAPGAPPCSEVPWLTPCAASVFHSYTYGGTYEVTLTVRDVGGNEASVIHPITVVGPAPPSPPAPPSGGSSSGGSPAAGTSTAGGSSGSSGAGSTPKPIPGPVASQAVVSHSLSVALKRGLLIGYSVNEQVAGQFQVLLAASVAARIGLHGPLATGMPPGSAPAIVIAKAILITTTGGRNTVKILFGKKTAAKLRKLRSVSLTIRLVVRNASSHSPLTTTVISTVTLSH